MLSKTVPEEEESAYTYTSAQKGIER